MSTSAPTNNPQRLTVAMIACDAEPFIADTLASVKNIADEIVVVDTGSQDNTRHLAAAAGAKVVDWAWTDDFSAARNVALSHATGDWVFWIDAGEMMTVSDAARLRQFVNEIADPNNVYMMLIKLPPEPGQVAGEQVGRFRLMPRRDDILWEGRIREDFSRSAVAAGMQVSALDPRIHRPARDLEAHVKQQKAERDIPIALMEIAVSPTLARPYLAKGEAQVNLGDMSSARQSFQTARELAAAGSSEMLESYYGELTTYDDSDPQQRDQQLELSLESLEHFPTDTQLLCAMGSYLQGQGRIDLAHRAYQTAFEHGQVRPEIWHLGDINDVALVCLSLTLQLQNQDSEARAILEKALADGRTGADRVRRQLIEICIKQHDRPAALAQVEGLASVGEGVEALRSAVRGAFLAAQGNWISAKAYLETALQAGCRDTLCFRWLSKALISMNEIAEAQQILQQWQASEPHNPEIAILFQSLGGQEPAPGFQAPGIQAPEPAASGPNLRIDRPTAEPTTTSRPHQAPAQQPSPPTPGV